MAQVARRVDWKQAILGQADIYTTCNKMSRAALSSEGSTETGIELGQMRTRELSDAELRLQEYWSNVLIRSVTDMNIN